MNKRTTNLGSKWKYEPVPSIDYVNAYFYYMWNRFTKEECHKIWGNVLGDHFFKKWCGMNRDFHASAERLWAEMSQYNRQLILNRAWQLYGKNR